MPDSSRIRKPLVSLVSVEKGYEESEDAVDRAISLIGGLKGYVKTGEKVLIKPNFCVAKPPSTGATTSPRVLEELVKLVLEIGGNPIIGEGSAYPLSTKKVFKKLGICDLGTKYGIDVVDLNKDEISEVSVPNHLAVDKIRIAKTALTCDRIISVAKLKIHEIAKVSLSLKNMNGTLPGIEKHVSHRKGLEKAIADLCSVVKPTIAVVDGIIGSGGASAIRGKPVKSNLILAGNDPVAVDAICSYIMGFSPNDMGFLRYASMKDIGVSDIHEINTIGEDLEILRLKLAPLFTKTELKDRLSRYMEVKLHKAFRKVAYPTARFFRKIPEASVNTYCTRKAKIFQEKAACSNCGICILACPSKSVSLERGYPRIDVDTCDSCRRCIEACPSRALSILPHA